MLTELESLEDEYKYARLSLEEAKVNMVITRGNLQFKISRKWQIVRDELEDMVDNIVLLMKKERKCKSKSFEDQLVE